MYLFCIIYPVDSIAEAQYLVINFKNRQIIDSFSCHFFLIVCNFINNALSIKFLFKNLTLRAVNRIKFNHSNSSPNHLSFYPVVTNTSTSAIPNVIYFTINNCYNMVASDVCNYTVFICDIIESFCL